MAFEPIDDLGKVTINHYEAVLVASKHARHLNSVRLSKLAQLEEGTTEIEEIELRKITAVALRDLMQGKVTFNRTDTE
ncbi:MAG: DNA-directed RNA polymerase subunit omega [candidate division Zixibacteria bacterium]|nr:DNA-directed RNA polymerase subunit omega [candidate division Zixibacteria bacterium]